MKTKFITFLFVALLIAAPAYAIKIDLTDYAAQPANSGNAIDPWMALLVKNYNNVLANVDLPTPVGAQVFKIDQGDTPPSGSGFPVFGDDVKSINLPGGYDYIALHWGRKYEGFYVGGTANTFTSPLGTGLSWYAAFRPTPSDTPGVPDNGSTLILLGLAVAALTPLGRILRK